jgi:hypothetical protein
MQSIPASTAQQDDFLDLARCCAAFWNLFFIDQDNRKIYFRTTESGMPVIAGQYGIEAGHAIAGYHAFELSYLAHIYIRTYVSKQPGSDDTFALTYCPVRNSGLKTLNVLPDFFRPGDVTISRVKVNGLVVEVKDPHRFQIDIADFPENAVVEVEYLPHRRKRGRGEAAMPEERPATSGMQLGFDTSTPPAAPPE